LLCGSALNVMGKLLSGTAPLRGRAGLELVIPPLDYRLAAQFWGIADPRLAVKVNAIVGGTPAYRREFVRNDVPAGPDDFDAWVIRTVLNPETPLFREGRYLLAVEPDLRDTALYHSVLAAVAEGNGTRGAIAAYEANWGEVMGPAHVERLRRINSLISATGKYDTAATKLMCFSGAGFTRGLHELAASDTSILLVDAGELYGLG
jgi:hypothetical protein